MWMGPLSAWGALAMAALFAVSAYFQFATGVSGWVYAGLALLLGFGAVRTLRKMSGGLRLLAGAWGVAAGLLTPPLTVTRGPLSTGEWALLAVALAGLALTVLHQEAKKP